MNTGMVLLVITVAGRPRLRFPQRLSRRRQQHCHRSFHPRSFSAPGGGLGGGIQLSRRIFPRHRRRQDHRQGMIQLDIVTQYVVSPD